MVTSRAFFVISYLLAVAHSQTEDSYFSGINVIFRAFRECGYNDFLTCLKIRAVKSLSELTNERRVELFEGITLDKTEESDGKSDNKTVDLDEKQLPSDPDKREAKVDTILSERISRFLKSYTLQVRLNEPDSAFEGRRRGGGGGGGGGKGGGGALLAAGLMYGGFKALILKGVALLALKALLVAKLALVLGTILGLHKLFHHEHHGKMYDMHHGDEYDRIGRHRRDVGDFRSHLLAYKGHTK